MEQQNSITTTKYGAILQEIGRQMSRRKRDLFKRILLISWPLMILGGFLYVTNENGWLNLQLQSATVQTWVIGGVILGLLVLYYIFVSFIVSIEKRLWIDSAFDNKFIESSDSWRIAWKLSPPVIGFCSQILLRYIFPPVIIFGTLFASFFMFGMSVKVFEILFISLVVAAFIFFYLLKIRLRFAAFLFLDMYDPAKYSHLALFAEMKKLNEMSGSDGFKKALILNLGTDTVRIITSYVLDIIMGGMDSLGKAGGFAGAMIRPLAEESRRQIISFANLVAIYILYREARALMYNEPQKMNNYIYSLIAS